MGILNRKNVVSKGYYSGMFIKIESLSISDNRLKVNISELAIGQEIF